MDEMLKKQDVLDAIYAKMEKTDKPDVVLGLAAAMSTVKQMQAAPVNLAGKQEPCTDCISRQAVLNLAKFDGRDGLGSIIHAFDVEQLPPVKPAEKVGQINAGVLDKIRAEIADLDDADYDYEGYYKAVTDAVKIIDKYKERSE